jgi:hypothetical protein
MLLGWVEAVRSLGLRPRFNKLVPSPKRAHKQFKGLPSIFIEGKLAPLRKWLVKRLDSKRRIFDSMENWLGQFIHSSGGCSRQYLAKALEVQKELCQACKEYFRRTDPVFADARNAEVALNNFVKWYCLERKLSMRGKTPAELYFETYGTSLNVPEIKFPPELRSAGEVGVIFDEMAGIYILPHYGQVKQLFEGDYEKVPNYKGLVSNLVYQEGFIPPFILKRLIKNNRKRAVKVFAAVFESVKTLNDVLNLLRKHRSDWNEKPKPSVIPLTL